MKKLTVLIVEPNPVTLQCMTVVLNEAGYNPVRSADLQEAPRLAREIRPAAIIVTLDSGSDCEAEGWAVLHDLQTNPATAAAGIIVIVGPQRPRWSFVANPHAQRVLFLRQPVLLAQLPGAVRRATRAPSIRTNAPSVKHRSRTYRATQHQPERIPHRDSDNVDPQGGPEKATNVGAVLVPLDGSSPAESVIPLAAALADNMVVPLHLVQVLPDDRANLRDGAWAYLRGVASRLAIPTELQVSSGLAADEILACAATLVDPLIVMLTWGTLSSGDYPIGSVPEYVVRGGNAPVLLVRAGREVPTLKTIRQILVPLDGSPEAEAALTFARPLAQICNAELRLVRFTQTARLGAAVNLAPLPLPRDLAPQLRQELIQTAHDYLANVAVREQTRTGGYSLQTSTLEGNPEEALLQDEVLKGVDLIIATTRGRGQVSRLALGGVAARLLRAGTTTLLLVPPPQAGTKSSRAPAAAAVR